MDVHEATTTNYCKQPGCTNEARSPVGRYAYCPDHQGQTRQPTRSGSSTPPGDTVEQKLKSLAVAARAVDRAKQKARSLTEQALTAKAAAERAEAEFQQRARELLGDAA